LRGPHAVDADRLQGRQGNRPLRRRHRPRLDRDAARQDPLIAMGVRAIPLAFVAGVLSILSPCVLPILPLVLGAAASEHRLGPVALAAGLSVSFVAIGLFAATIGYSIGLDLGFFRNVGAVLMIAIGAILLVPHLQTQLAVAGAPLANWGGRHVTA